MPDMHEIDYKIFGDDMQFVEVELDPNEATVAEAGGMMYMDDGIEMETIFGDGSQQQGGFLGALMGAGKRLLTGESLFMTVFLNRSGQKKKVAFGAPYPGKIVADPSRRDRRRADRAEGLVPRRGQGRERSASRFRRKLGVGLFGGEGFIMQRLQGDGWAFVHAGGTLQERTLAAGRGRSASTPAASSRSSRRSTTTFSTSARSSRRCSAAKGLFFATLRGPGRVWLQSLPLSRLANRIIAAVPGLARGGREEGSILGGLGNLLDGDN